MTAPRGKAAGALIVALGLAVVALTPVAVEAQEPDVGTRSMTLDRREVMPGEAVIASMVGLRGESLTLSVCGNLAKRGSVDCANDTSVSDEIVSGGDISYTQIVVQPPPAPCPCIVRAVANDTRDFMVAPITILGHPVAEVVAPADEPLVEVTVDAQRAPEGLVESLRSALGGRTRYEATVTVRNLTTETLENVVVGGSAEHRLNDYAASLPPVRPGPIEPGATWTHTEVLEVAAPVMGTYRWTVTASGAGPTVTARQSVSRVPWLFIVFVMVLVVDLAAVLGRFLSHRRVAREAARLEHHGAGDDDGFDEIDDGFDEIDVRDVMPSVDEAPPVLT